MTIIFALRKFQILFFFCLFFYSLRRLSVTHSRCAQCAVIHAQLFLYFFSCNSKEIPGIRAFLLCEANSVSCNRKQRRPFVDLERQKSKQKERNKYTCVCACDLKLHFQSSFSVFNVISVLADSKMMMVDGRH